MTTFTSSREGRIRPDPAPHEPSRQAVDMRRYGLATTLFNVLDPIPYGFFVAAFIFDGVYDKSSEVLWVKASAWLIAMGLLFAVVPRLVNLAHVWFPGRRSRPAGAMAGFWLNLFAIAAAIVNAFVHSRDAYGVMPDGLWLSSLTVLLLVLAKVIATWQRSNESVS